MRRRLGKLLRLRPRPTASSRDQRRQSRIPVASVQASLRERGDVRVIDLSPTGLALEALERLRVGKSYLLELQHQGQPVDVVVEVRWISSRSALTPRGAVPVYRAGVAVIDVLGKGQGQGVWRSLRPQPSPGSRSRP